MSQTIIRIPDMLKAPEDAKDPQPRYAVWDSVSNEFVSWDITANEVLEDDIAAAVERVKALHAVRMSTVEQFGTSGRTVPKYNPLEYHVLRRDGQHGDRLNENSQPDRMPVYLEFLARVRAHFGLPAAQTTYEEDHR